MSSDSKVVLVFGTSDTTTFCMQVPRSSLAASAFCANILEEMEQDTDANTDTRTKISELFVPLVSEPQVARAVVAFLQLNKLDVFLPEQSADFLFQLSCAAHCMGIPALETVCLDECRRRLESSGREINKIKTLEKRIADENSILFPSSKYNTNVSTLYAYAKWDWPPNMLASFLSTLSVTTLAHLRSVSDELFVAVHGLQDYTFTTPLVHITPSRELVDATLGFAEKFCVLEIQTQEHSRLVHQLDKGSQGPVHAVYLNTTKQKYQSTFSSSLCKLRYLRIGTTVENEMTDYLSSCKHLRHLEFDSFDSINSQIMQQIACLRELQVLKFKRMGLNKLDAENARPLASLKKLQYLEGAFHVDALQNLLTLKDNLRHLHLKKSLWLLQPNGIGVQGAKVLGLFRHLTSLTIGGWNDMNAKSARHLAALKSLEYLKIGRENNLGAEGMRHIACLTNLTCLEIGCDNNVGAEGIRALKEMKCLSSLRIESSNDLGVEGARQLACLEQLTCLKVGGFNGIGAKGAKYLALLGRLQTLEIGANNLCTEGLQHLSSLKELRRLYIGRRNILLGAKGMQHLACLPHLESLKIDSHNSIGAKGIWHLGFLKNLRYLEIGDCNKIGAKGAQCLVSCIHLHDLIIGDSNKIGAEGMRYIASINQLRRLSIGDSNNIGAKGAQHLPRLIYLEDLSIGHFNNVGADGLSAIAQLKCLQHFSIGMHENNLGPFFLDENEIEIPFLETALPHTKIQFFELSY